MRFFLHSFLGIIELWEIFGVKNTFAKGAGHDQFDGASVKNDVGWLAVR